MFPYVAGYIFARHQFLRKEVETVNIRQIDELVNGMIDKGRGVVFEVLDVVAEGFISVEHAFVDFVFEYGGVLHIIRVAEFNRNGVLDVLAVLPVYHGKQERIVMSQKM